jgi:hypothetical protein
MHLKRLAVSILLLASLGLASCGSAPTRVASGPSTSVTTTTLDLSFDGKLPPPTPAEQVKLNNESQWVATLEAQRLDAAAVLAKQAEADRQAALARTIHTRKVVPRTTVTHSVPAPSQASSVSGGTCGGNLPPCYVVKRESGGSPTAQNPHSTASGTYQFVDGTWNGYGGYQHAKDAPQSVQAAKAAEIWNGGKGCSHWNAC